MNLKVEKFAKKSAVSVLFSLVIGMMVKVNHAIDDDLDERYERLEQERKNQPN